MALEEKEREGTTLPFHYNTPLLSDVISFEMHKSIIA
jgi:hypothetical protein